MYGQLGHGDTQSRLSPCPIEALEEEEVELVACGYRHCMVTLSNGEVYAWGCEQKIGV